MFEEAFDFDEPFMADDFCFDDDDYLDQRLCLESLPELEAAGPDPLAPLLRNTPVPAPVLEPEPPAPLNQAPDHTPEIILGTFQMLSKLSKLLPPNDLDPFKAKMRRLLSDMQTIRDKQ
jgi:hypothetical protein